MEFYGVLTQSRKDGALRALYAEGQDTRCDSPALTSLSPSRQTLDSFRLNSVLRKLGDKSERWHGQADDVGCRDQFIMEAVETPWKGAPQYLQEQENQPTAN